MTQKINEVAPPGWGHTKAEKEKTKPNKPKSKIGGTAHEFQKDLDSGKFKGLPGDKTYKDKKASMFKLMWSMKNKGDKPHYKPGVKNKLKAKYKEKNEMIDPKKIRNYKNVSNATVEKANKEAEKVKDKEQKGTLQFPEMPQENLSLAPKGKGKKAAKALYKEETFVERILELDYKEFGFETQKDLIEYATDYFKEGSLNPAQRKAREASRSHSTLGKGRRLHGGRGADHPKGAMGSGRGKFTYDRPAGTKRKPGREKIVATPVKK